jgi:hypothetical protein
VHAAPPVRVTFGRSAGWVVFTAVLGAAAAANVAAWVAMRSGLSVAGWLALAAAVAGGLATAAWMWHRQAPGLLEWDGERWRWAGCDGDARVAIDLGGWMLLRFSAAAAGHAWIAASRGQTKGAWTALRSALFSRRPADLAPDAPSV